MLADSEDTAAYRIYVTDCLRGLTQADKRYWDIVYADTKKEPEKAKTGDEIAADVISKLKLSFQNEEMSEE